MSRVFPPKWNSSDKMKGYETEDTIVYLKMLHLLSKAPSEYA